MRDVDAATDSIVGDVAVRLLPNTNRIRISAWDAETGSDSVHLNGLSSQWDLVIRRLILGFALCNSDGTT